MENWQLTLVILASVFVGAMIPFLIMMAMALWKLSSSRPENYDAGESH